MSNEINITRDDLKCALCLYFRRLDADRGQETSVGECRRYPPQVVIEEDDTPFSYFPVVSEDELCGELVWKQH